MEQQQQHTSEGMFVTSAVISRLTSIEMLLLLLFFSVLFCLVCLFFFVFFSYFSFHPVAECTHEFVHGRIGHSLLNFLRHSDPQATPTNGEAPKLDTNTEESGPAVNASLSCVVSVSVRARLQSMGGRRR